MSHLKSDSRRIAGVMLVVFPSVLYGGIMLLTYLIQLSPGYLDNPLRQNLFRAGHAHAGVLLVLSLVLLRYVDEAVLSEGWKHFIRLAAPSAAILLPTGFFFSVLSPQSAAPSGWIALCFAGAAVLATGLIALGVGLLRRPVQSGH